MEAKAVAGRVESTPTETLRTGGEEIKGDCNLWKSNRAVDQMIRLPPLPEWLLGASAGLGRVLTIILSKAIDTISLLLSPSER